MIPKIFKISGYLIDPTGRLEPHHIKAKMLYGCGFPLVGQHIMAKEMYQQNGDQAHRDKLMESVGKLMVEVYDMLSSMVMDSDFAEERKEIQRQIKKLAEM